MSESSSSGKTIDESRSPSTTSEPAPAPKRERSPAQIAALEKARATREAKRVAKATEVKPGVPRVSPLRDDLTPRERIMEDARRRQLGELTQRDLVNVIKRFDGRPVAKINALGRIGMIDAIISAERKRR